MKVLVTGGRGLIASLFARRLISDGHDVVIIDDGREPRHQFNSIEGPVYYDQRLEHMNAHVLTDVVGSCDQVLHAAASTGIPYSAEHPLDDWQRNVDGTIALLEALRRKPRPTVVLSSVKPYGLGRLLDTPEGVDESFPLEPDEGYAASKAAQSHVCRAYAVSYGIPLVTFRCSNLFGNAAPHGARHGWASWFAIRAALGWPIEIQGSGLQRRDLLFASDVGEAVLLAWEKIESVTGQIFNLGGGPANLVSVAGAYDILRQFGSKSRAVPGPGRRFEDDLFVTNTAAVRKALGWAPAVSHAVGLRIIYDWAREHREALERVYEP